MSVSYIELSSDEEIEIITEKKNCSKLVSENATSVKNSKYSLPNAVERLTNNSNIELTIGLDKPKEENGLRFDRLKELLTTKDQSDNRTPPKDSIISSDIIVIDIDKEEEEEKLQKDVFSPFFWGKMKGELKTYSKSKPISKTEKPSRVVVENGDMIYVIDDDDDDDDDGGGGGDDDDDDECTILSESAFNNCDNINNELKDPLEIDENMVTNQLEEISQSHINEKYENLTKNTVSLNKLLSLKSTKPNTEGILVPSTSTSLKHQLPITIVKLPSELTIPIEKPSKSAIPITTPFNLTSSESDDESSNEVMILSDESDQTKVTTTKELKPWQRAQPEQDPLALNPFQNSKLNSSLKASDAQKFTSSEQSSSQASYSKVNLTKYGIDDDSHESIANYSIENMFDGLVKVSCKIFQDENLGTRLWRYFRATTEDVLKSEDFLNALTLALKSSEDVKNPSYEDKLYVSRNLKEVMRILKRQPEQVNKNLQKLRKMLQIIHARIRKLEEMEVTSSDDETENVYCLLDRHRVRAAKIYSKICQLEGKAAHAGRATLQKFHFSGTSGYSKIEHALEKYFNKTRLFPDFLDVKTLIESTIQKEKLQVPPIEIHNIAQSIFLEFGNKLQRMRKCDDYAILVDYLDDGTKDPALDNEDLFRKLEENKKIRRKEEEILADYTKKQSELKTKSGIKSDEEDAVDKDSEDNGSAKEEYEKLSEKNLQFSDTEDELINEDVESECDRKRKRSVDDQLSLSPNKRSISELDEMEVNLKLVTDVAEKSIGTQRNDSDIIMNQLGLTNKGKQKRI